MPEADEASSRAPGRPALPELVGLVSILIGFFAVAVFIVAKGAPLGHDEAVYALRTRHMVEGASSAYYWNDFRAPGFPAVLSLVYRIHGTEPILRLSVAAFGGGMIIATWLLGRDIFGRAAGLVAAAGVAFTPALLASATSIWPDIPGAALGLMAITIVYFATRGDQVSWWVLGAVPVALLATAVRFGAPLPIGIGVLGVLAYHRRAARRGLLPLGVAVTATAVGTGLIVLTPWVFGTADAPYTAIRTLQRANDFPISQGIVDYARQAEFLVLTLAGVLLTIGVVVAVVTAATDRSTRSAVSFVASIGVLTFLGIVLTLHGEYRYLAPVYPLLWVIAGFGLVRLAVHLPRALSTTVVVVVTAALLFGGATSGGDEAAKTLDRFRPLRAAGRLIADEADAAPCGVITSYVPQMSWYSGCVTRDFELDRVVIDSPSFAEGSVRFMVVVADGKRQPAGSLLLAYVAAAVGPPETVGDTADGPLGFVEIYLLPSS